MISCGLLNEPQPLGIRWQWIQGAFYHAFIAFGDSILTPETVAMKSELKPATTQLSNNTFGVVNSRLFCVQYHLLGRGSGAARSTPLGWRSGERLCLPPRQANAVSVVAARLDRLSGDTLQRASDRGDLAVCRTVCVRGGGYHQYVQEILIASSTLSV